jgi:ribonuclease I
MEKELNEYFAQLMSISNELRKSGSDKKLLESLEIKIIQLSEFLNDNNFNSTNSNIEVKENNNQHDLNNTLRISIKAKLTVLDDVIRDLNYQKEHKSNLDNQQKSVNLAMSYVNRKIKYYIDRLEELKIKR